MDPLQSQGNGPGHGRPPGRNAVVPGLALLGIVALMGFIGAVVPYLWGESGLLLRDWDRANHQIPMAFVDIHPIPSFARKPDDWVRTDGDDILLWSGWSHDAGEHRWFRLGSGHLDVGRLQEPMGRDVVRAIDRAIVESQGGSHWSAMPPSAECVCLDIEGVSTAYPLKLLEKVEVVNDLIAERPVLVVHTPFVDRDEAVHVYDPLHQGHRFTLGLTGYFSAGAPLLYDRGTESFWLAEIDGLYAVAGRLRGERLPALAPTELVSWRDWAGRHPRGRLVVGADRSLPLPPE